LVGAYSRLFIVAVANCGGQNHALQAAAFTPTVRMPFMAFCPAQTHAISLLLNFEESLLSNNTESDDGIYNQAR
jgi:hypothetical protein